MSYEEELDLKIAKYCDPYYTFDYITRDEIELLKIKVKSYFLNNKQDLLDIRVVGKVNDYLAECTISPSYSSTAFKVTELDGKFTVNVTIDPHDPDPETTLNFIASEFNRMQPDVEIKVVPADEDI
ncbi:hypothetical protein ST201phi2-1p084 [Pseudomonas phage 201phi2-1]|uniref:Uncharacterized protein n=1 Tax=Pseudomonas phage 201phi2-1 TaxID=198110 RepID=B3FK59_BP201|nr:hypothetical protein ST201phi2-1p084 [Pseudomonas phage 201phi2-1]ABY62917.1 hypothetical protein 201phi2-1p084 [Pseudomonas phage 201phi2-1]